jgi:hypothetical protein
MRRDEALLEPFAPEILAAIRAAFRAGWQELAGDQPNDNPILRNKLAGTLARLARSGIQDADELKRQALLRLSAVKLGPAADAAAA